MRTGLRNALVFTLLVAAAALTWYWSRPAPERAGTGAEQGEALGYAMLDAVLSSTNADGLIDFEIRTARLTELPSEDRVVLEDLVVAQTLEDSAWRISADKALGPADGSVLALDGTVVIVLERASGDPYVLRMPHLELERSSRVARSRGPIALEAGAVRLTAEALAVDLNTPGLRLESVTGMRTSQITSAAAAAALSAASAAQDGADSAREAVFRSASMECAEECVIYGFEAVGENWQLKAGQAHAARMEDVQDGRFSLSDVRFAFDDMSLTAPSAVFEFADKVLVQGELGGDRLEFESGAARFEARSIRFSFEGGELAAAELSGDPAIFENTEARDTVTAETIRYDYRESIAHVPGLFTLNRNGRLEVHCRDLRYYLGTTPPRFNSGPCDIESSAEDRAAPAARENEARGGEAPDSAAPAERDGTP